MGHPLIEGKGNLGGHKQRALLERRVKVVKTWGEKQKKGGPQPKAENEDNQQDCKARQDWTTVTLGKRKT